MEVTDLLLRLRIIAPAEFLTLNRQGTRGSWRDVSTLKRQWYDATAWAVRSQLRDVARPLPPCRLEWDFHVRLRRRRDPDNYVLTRKPILDCMVREGLWVDDAPEFISNSEIQFVVTDKTQGVIVRAYPR